MKSFNHLYEIAISEEVRRKAVHNVCVGARKSREFRRYAKNEELAVKLSYKWITEYKNDSHKTIEIYDGISRKKRKIVVPTFKELVVQHCVVEALKPMFRRGMYRHSYASIPKQKIKSGNKVNGIEQYLTDVRGAHAGKKRIERWLRTDRKNTKYVLKMDIRHYFDSIPHDILKDMLRKRIHDERMLNLIFAIIDVVDCGLPIGFYTSQWLSNWYLTGLDHYIKEELRAVYYIRYMDDMVIFGSNKRKLHRMREAVQEYLKTLGLELKDNYQIFRFAYENDGKIRGRFLDFMGFRFYRRKTTLRRSIMLKATRKARKLSKKDKPTIYDLRQMMSYNGYIKATDTYNVYQTRIKPYFDIKKAKERIGGYDRRRFYEISNSARNAGRKAA